MNSASEEKIKKLKSGIAGARSSKQKCSLMIDLAMELRYSDPVSSLSEAQEALAISEEINFIVGKARSHFCIGLVYFNLSDYEKAFVFLDRAYHFFLDVGDKWGTSNALNHLGLIYLRLGDYTKALENFSSSIEIKKESEDHFGTANVMISMAAIHRETGNLSDARSILTESLRISEEFKSDTLISRGLMELGIVLSIEKRFSEATEKFYEARSFFEKQNNVSGIAQCFLQLGKLKSASGDAADAVALYLEGKRIAEAAGDKSLIILFLSDIAAEKLKSREISEAINLLHEARELALETQEKPVLALISLQLSTANEASGNLKDALLEYKNFITLKDEINSAETTTLLQNQQISAKVEALEKENKMLELEKMLAVENVRARISRDIHDEIGSGLTKISLTAQRLKLSLQNKASPDLSILDKITGLSKEVTDQLGEIIWTVNPKHDNLGSLLSYFRNYITRFLEDVPLTYSIEFPDLPAEVLTKEGSPAEVLTTGGSSNPAKDNPDNTSDFNIHPDLKRNLFLVLKESLNNIVKHAQARHVIIRFQRQQNHFHFEISDDGIGMKDLSGREFGNGLANMKQRIESVNAKFEIHTAQSSGTAIHIHGDLYY